MDALPLEASVVALRIILTSQFTIGLVGLAHQDLGVNRHHLLVTFQRVQQLVVRESTKQIGE